MQTPVWLSATLIFAIPAIIIIIIAELLVHWKSKLAKFPPKDPTELRQPFTRS